MRAEHENQNIPYHVGQNLDVKDSVGKWINAEVIFAGNGVIFVHYSGWSFKYDEQLPINSHRILTQWEYGKPIQMNNRVDVYHPVGGWLQARVIQIQQDKRDNQMVKVHFFNYHPKYDTYVDLKNKQAVAVIGQKSKAFGIGKKKRNNAKISQLAQKILQKKIAILTENLQNKNLILKKSEGDGNCLFRSISDQLYGTEKFHEEVRRICMDYMEYQKSFFQNYVSQDIDQYIKRKRMNGVWGDDVEIQAISQIYSRPIEIYVVEDKPIRTFHQQNQRNETPIRLAFIGSCHYDSIKEADKINDGLIKSQFGTVQQLFFTTYKKQEFHDNLRADRDVFSICNRLQDTIEQHLLAENREQSKIQDQLAKALEASETEAILEEIQKNEMKQLELKYEQEKIQEQLKRIEQEQIQQAKKLSALEGESYRRLRPFWFNDLLAQGFSEEQIWFAIDANGQDPDIVQNFLLDNYNV